MEEDLLKIDLAREIKLFRISATLFKEIRVTLCSGIIEDVALGL